MSGTNLSELIRQVAVSDARLANSPTGIVARMKEMGHDGVTVNLVKQVLKNMRQRGTEGVKKRQRYERVCSMLAEINPVFMGMLLDQTNADAVLLQQAIALFPDKSDEETADLWVEEITKKYHYIFGDDGEQTTG